MNRRIVSTGLVFVTLFCLGLGHDAFAGLNLQNLKSAISSTDDLKLPKPKKFKLKGAGQFDLPTLSLEFTGKASEIGKYNATGTVDPVTFEIHGTFTAVKGDCFEFDAAKDDSINWVAGFQQGPLGDIQATFTFTGGTGKFVGATGTAAGPVVLDPDFMFTIVLEGTIAY